MMQTAREPIWDEFCNDNNWRPQQERKQSTEKYIFEAVDEELLTNVPYEGASTNEA
jgi:hypothetical protein